MPIPPPPAVALKSRGYPISAATARASSTDSSGRSTPVVTGTPRRAIDFLAAILSPGSAIASGGGPTKTSPSSAQRAADDEFFERNPQPGHIASARES